MPGEHHGNAMLVAGLDDLFVTHRTARLDDSGHAVAREHVHTIAEREERIGCSHEALGGHTHALARLMRTFAGKLGGVDTVGLTRTHADARMVFGNQDGVGLDTLADLPREHELVELFRRGLALGGNGELGGKLAHAVKLLNQQAAVDGAVFQLAGAIDAAGGQHAQVLLLGKQLQRAPRKTAPR